MSWRKRLTSVIMWVSGALTAVFAVPVIIFALPLYVIIKSADRLIKMIDKS